MTKRKTQFKEKFGNFSRLIVLFPVLAIMTMELFQRRIIITQTFIKFQFLLIKNITCTFFLVKEMFPSYPNISFSYLANRKHITSPKCEDVKQ